MSLDIKKILWATDPFEERDETQAKVIAVLRQWATQTRAAIEPVFALSSDQLDLHLDIARSPLEYYRPAAERALSSLARESELPGVVPPHIVLSIDPSLRSAVRQVIDYAKVTQADLIVAGSHGRKGFDRWMLGSFAESLITDADRPVLIVGAQSKIRSNLKKILFPTDLKPQTDATFHRMLKLARDLDAELILHHVIPRPIEPVFQSGVYLLGGGWTPVPLFLTKQEAMQRHIADQWLDEAKRIGTQASLVIDSGTPSIVEAILGRIDSTQADFIAMPAQSGRISSTFLGSITRQVVRGAHCPVWVERVHSQD